MDMLKTDYIERTAACQVFISKSDDEICKESYRPIATVQVAEGLWLKAGVYYAGKHAEQWRVWFTGDLSGVKAAFNKTVTIPWRRTKKVQGEMHVNCFVDVNSVKASASNTVFEDTFKPWMVKKGQGGGDWLIFKHHPKYA